jgi:Holliday junction resolvase-like predicted endonuclease
MSLPYNKERGEWGKEAERIVTEKLRQRGLDAVMPERQFENRADYAKYETDIIVRAISNPEIQVSVEVKRRSEQFKSYSDFLIPQLLWMPVVPLMPRLLNH